MEKLLAEYICILDTGLKETNFAEDRRLIEMYLADAALLLAKVVLEVKITSDEMHAHERLRGNSWLRDQKVYEISQTKWQEFKTITETK